MEKLKDYLTVEGWMKDLDQTITDSSTFKYKLMDGINTLYGDHVKAQLVSTYASFFIPPTIMIVGLLPGMYNKHPNLLTYGLMTTFAGALLMADATKEKLTNHAYKSIDNIAKKEQKKDPEIIYLEDYLK